MATGTTLSHLVQVNPTHYTATFTAAPGIDIADATVSRIAGSWHGAATPAKRGAPASARPKPTRLVKEIGHLRRQLGRTGCRHR
jgi:hypothetical protein